MTIDELVAAVTRTVVDERRIQEFEIRLQRAEKEFEVESRNRIVDEDFLSRAYCL